MPIAASPLFPTLPIIATGLGLLLAALLWMRRGGNERANGWLAVAVGSGALAGLALYTDWLLFLVGPCVWLYTCRLTRVNGPYGKRLAVHFFPAVALLLALLPFYLRSTPGRVEALPLLAAVQGLFYGWLSLLRLKRHAQAGGSSFRGARTVVAVGLMLGAAWTVSVFSGLDGARQMLALSLPLALYVLGVLALLQPAED
ncbi:MAG: hypothetical protein ABW136_02465 [Steroidobacteraceae bacterium]